MQPMQNVINPIANIYQTQLEASRQLADAIFSGTEKIDHVMLDASHRAFTEQLRFVQSLAAVRDPQSMASAQSTFMSHRPDRAMDYQRELMRIFTEMQSEIGRSMRTAVEQLGSSAINGSSATLEAAENQASEVFNPLTGMFSIWESAFREMTSMTNKNMSTAGETFESAASNAYENATDAYESASDAAEEVLDAATSGRERKGTSSSHSRRSK